MRKIALVIIVILSGGCYHGKKYIDKNDLVDYFSYNCFCDHRNCSENYTSEIQSIDGLNRVHSNQFKPPDLNLAYEIKGDKIFLALEISIIPFYFFSPSATFSNDTIKVSLNGVRDTDQTINGEECPHIFKIYLRKPSEGVLENNNYHIILDQILKGKKIQHYNSSVWPPVDTLEKNENDEGL